MQSRRTYVLALVVPVRCQHHNRVLQRLRKRAIVGSFQLLYSAVSCSYYRYLGSFQYVRKILVIVGEIVGADVLLKKFQIY